MTTKIRTARCAVFLLTTITMIGHANSVNSLGMEFRKVEGGTFAMGSMSEGLAAWPSRQVTVSSFEIMTTEVTQEQFEAITRRSISEQRDLRNPDWPLKGEGANYPAYYVSWYDAVVYANRLSLREGLVPVYSTRGSTNPDDWGNVPTRAPMAWWEAIEMDREADGYRLPTEAEWEYAARGGRSSAGTRYAGSNEADEVAWYRENSDGAANVIARKVPNELGLYDMSGNVSEWVWDRFDRFPNHAENDPRGPDSGVRGEDGHRVFRGGSWGSNELRTRTARRNSSYAWSRYNFIGFRLVRAYRTRVGTIELSAFQPLEL